jgi:hypothetical protein
MDTVATYSLVPRMDSETVVSFGKGQVTSRDHGARTLVEKDGGTG